MPLPIELLPLVYYSQINWSGMKDYSDRPWSSHIRAIVILPIFGIVPTMLVEPSTSPFQTEDSDQTELIPDKFGSNDWIRTSALTRMKGVLYQLSYIATNNGFG